MAKQVPERGAIQTLGIKVNIYKVCIVRFVLYSSKTGWGSALFFVFSLRHFGHLSHCCFETAVTVFIILYFQTVWPKWCNFFWSFQKYFGLKKKTGSATLQGRMWLSTHTSESHSQVYPNKRGNCNENGIVHLPKARVWRQISCRWWGSPASLQCWKKWIWRKKKIELNLDKWKNVGCLQLLISTG